jgi:hypothetical protein
MMGQNHHRGNSLFRSLFVLILFIVPALLFAADAQQPASQQQPASWSEVRENVKETSENAWSATKSTSQKAWEATRDGSNKAWKETQKASGNLWDDAKKLTLSTWNRLKKLFSN